MSDSKRKKLKPEIDDDTTIEEAKKARSAMVLGLNDLDFASASSRKIIAVVVRAIADAEASTGAYIMPEGNYCGVEFGDE